jgi:hypothetical protein
VDRRLLYLQSEWAGAEDPRRRGELAARLASYLARLGRFAEANNIVSATRAQVAFHETGSGALWIMLAEGIIAHFEFQSIEAIDRIIRAQTLALAFRELDVIASASAWRAHIEFERCEFDSMLRSLKIAISKVSDNDADANLRIAMIISNCLTLSGDGDLAKKWFTAAHSGAVKIGDQASLEAMLYNRAVLTLSRLRVMNCSAAIDQADLRDLRSDFNSASNLTFLIGGLALRNHLLLSSARLDMLEGRFAEAIPKLENAAGQAPFARNHFQANYLALECTFCKKQITDHDSVKRFFELNPNLQFDGLDIDEQLVANWMLLDLNGNEMDKNAQLQRAAVFEDLMRRYYAINQQLRTDLASLQPVGQWF